jgi:hypothetical protein
MTKYIIAAAVVASTSTSCLAAEEFYVVQDAKTKNCSIETKKPDGTAAIMIGTSSYATQGEAKKAKKAAPECNVKENPKKRKPEEKPQ